jgi:hypothetical protein
LWVLISRLLSLHNKPMFNAELQPEPAYSPTKYNPYYDEFNPADDMAYKLWKAALFTIGDWFFIYFAVALWLWFKTSRNASLLSDKGLDHYYYSLLFLLFNFLFYALIFFCVVYRIFSTI